MRGRDLRRRARARLCAFLFHRLTASLTFLPAPAFTRVLSLASPTALIALQEFNKLLVHHEATLLSYSLDLLARVALAQAPARSLAASLEHVAPPDTSVAFCRAGRFGERTLGERRCSFSDVRGAGAHASRQSCTRRKVSCR